MAKKKGWIIFFVLLGIFVLFGVMFLLGIKTFMEDKPIVQKNTVLKITLSGLVTEKLSRDAFGRELEGANLQMYDIQRGLKMAKVDHRIPGVYVRLGGMSLGWAKAQEIRQLLENFKKSGKFVTTFMSGCDEKSLYLSLAADDVYLQPHSGSELNGFAAELPFLKRLFKKVGIQPQVERIGKYKSAGDIFTRESMSPAQQEATQALLADINDDFVTAVCQKFNLSRKDFTNRLNKGIFRAEDIYGLNFVTGLKYESQVLDEIKQKIYSADSSAAVDKTLHTIDIRRYAKVSPAEVGLNKGEKIALIYAVGTITSGSSGYEGLSGRTMGAQSIMQMLRTAGKNDKIKAVVLRVDSPGGSGLASDNIWSAVQKLRKKKPVIISMGDVAASGGYWISMGSDAIVAQPLTITGSIGVLSLLFNLSETYNKLGIDWATVKTGDHADIMTDKRALTPDEWKIFKQMNRDFYQYFVEKAADGRNKTFTEIDKVAQGRVWSGKRALQYGLVDTLGGLDVALQVAKNKVGLKASAPTQWIVYPQPKSFFETLFEKLSVKAVNVLSSEKTDISLRKNLPIETRNLLQKVAAVALVKKGDVLALATDIPEVN